MGPCYYVEPCRMHTEYTEKSASGNAIFLEPGKMHPWVRHSSIARYRIPGLRCVHTISRNHPKGGGGLSVIKNSASR